MTTITINFEWPEIHRRFAELDAARTPLNLGRFELFYDIFGGTYVAPTWERHGLPGLITLSRGLDTISQEVWKYLHEMNALVRSSNITHAAAVATSRRMCAVVLAIANCKMYLHSIGLRADPAHEICGSGGGITGLRWLAGCGLDEGATLDEIRRFVATGDIGVFAT